VRPLIFQGADYSDLPLPINPVIQQVIEEKQNVVITQLEDLGFPKEVAKIVCSYHP